MKIQNVNQQTFQKKHYISKDAQKNLSSLIGKMDKASSYPNPNSLLDAKIMQGIKFDNSIFLKGIGKDKVSLVTINNKTGFFINNETGEVKKFKKPFFSRWKNIIPKGEKVIETANKHFDDNFGLKKIFLKMPSWEEAKKMCETIIELRSKLHNIAKEYPII